MLNTIDDFKSLTGYHDFYRIKGLLEDNKISIIGQGTSSGSLGYTQIDNMVRNIKDKSIRAEIREDYIEILKWINNNYTIQKIRRDNSIEIEYDIIATKIKG